MTPKLFFAYPAAPGLLRLQAVKVCGIVCPEDALMVARSFHKTVPPHVRLLLGMILWPNSRRSVTHRVAREIAKVAHDYDATAVGVFVDEDVETMEETCVDCGVNVAQLHGFSCRSAWANRADNTSLRWIDVRDVNTNGLVSSKTNSSFGSPLWSLYDAKGGGTGTPFDWDRFTPPDEPWLLAGGLDSHNVKEAVHKLSPNGVDVATGVAGSDKCRKEKSRVQLFLDTLVDAYSRDV